MPIPTPQEMFAEIEKLGITLGDPASVAEGMGEGYGKDYQIPLYLTTMPELAENLHKQTCAISNVEYKPNPGLQISADLAQTNTYQNSYKLGM